MMLALNMSNNAAIQNLGTIVNRVLVVEDDESIRELLVLGLAEEGFEVVAVGDGQTALTKCQSQVPPQDFPFDLIVLDLMLPQVSGLDLCRFLRYQGNHVPILIVSAKTTETDRVLGLEVGADDYISKPFSMRELVARCRALLRRQRLNVPTEPTIVQFQEIVLYPEEYRVVVRGVGVVQPQIFAIMLMRYGGTESVNESARATEKIANGQCIFVRRQAYLDTGGHGAVRGKVAEDLAMAQLYFTMGRRSFLVLGLTQLSTRMYTSLREIAEGWGKNIYAGGRESAPFGAFGRLIYPILLVAPALSGLVPPLLIALSLAGVVGHGVLIWAAIAGGANLIWWLVVYALLGLSPAYAILHPLGSAALLYIALASIVRGKRVRWKERDYIAA